MGVVYAAHDTLRQETVALKTFLFLDADAIYRLKKEFRALTGVVHPHLVALYEFVGENGEWFYTMELLDGVDFMEYTRPAGPDIARLRAILPGIADGLLTVHAAGKLHRDLKPSNVMVTAAGRPVILDFGIATDIAPESLAPRTIEQGVWGTPLYMSPEQANGAAEPASDWYAIGVMLYEALTGVAPFEGNFFRMLVTKMDQDPPRPDALVPGLPSDLVGLCVDLMAREPGARPTGEDLLRRLGGRASVRNSRRSAGALVGRAPHLAALHDALAATREGQPITMLLHGPSGSGKSALLDAFLGEAAALPGAVVLASRCFVRESVPYKGLDGVLDSLARWLLALPAERLDPMLTPSLAAAARLFPALGRIPGLPAAPDAEAQDPEQIRRRATGALRGLFAELSIAGPLILTIDDLQWGDADSINVLEEILAPPGAPGILLIAAFRAEEVAGHPFLEAAAQRARAGGARDLSLEPLSSRESRELARRVLGGEEAEVASVVEEAGGSPFLLEMLARHAMQTRDDTGPRRIGVSAGEMLHRRLAELPPEAERLLETLAVAARPLDALVARDVSGIPDERPLADLLRAEHLLRPAARADYLELYHDRIRETMAARLDPARLPGIHRRLAHALEARGGDPETLYEHFREAGEPLKARRYAVAAADVAAHSLAFERAATLYERAIELARAAGENTHALEGRRADALANAGRAIEAADLFLSVAGHADPVEALELRRRAADQLLRCGHVERGFQVVDTVLTGVGVRPSRSRVHALLRMLARRATLRLRGLRFTPRASADLPPATIRRLDVCWTVALGLVRVDNLRAADFQTHHLLLALRAGEPYRIARALACEASFVALPGGPARARSFRLLDATRRLAEETGHPHAIGISHLAESVVRHFMGEFALSSRQAVLAEEILRGRCTGVWWEIDSAQEYGMASDYYRGAWDEVARRTPGRLREGQAHGDRYAVADVAAGRPNITWLMRDESAEARRVVAECIAPWSHEAFHVPQWLSLFAECQIDFYEDRGGDAWERNLRQWPALANSMLLRIQVPRVEAYQLRARCALAAAPRRPPSERGALLRRARADADHIARQKMAWSTPLADLIRAAAAAQERREAECLTILRGALRDLESAGLAAHAAAARRRLGSIVGGDEGGAQVRAADAWFAGIGGQRGDRLTATLAPGFPG